MRTTFTVPTYRPGLGFITEGSGVPYSGVGFITEGSGVPYSGVGFITEGSGVPLYGLGQTDPSGELEQKYQSVREWCNDNLGPEACNKFLPYSVYNAIGEPRESRLPWWAWMLLGALAGRMLRV